ncbi:MAG TPA: hypothetical protein VF731_01715 [Solirubrobacterales bacterium]
MSYLDEILGGEERQRVVDRERQVAAAIAGLLDVKEIDGAANPYLERFLEISGGRGWGYHRFAEFEANSAEWVNAFEQEMVAARARASFVRWFAWAIPTEEALALVHAGGEVVEVGAGGGYWAGLLRARGVTVHAYDRAPHENYQVAHGWSPVQRAGVRAAGWHPEATLLLCWPPYDHRMAEVAVERYWRAGGRRVAYVGEIGGGCTGESSRLEALDPVAEAAIPQWPGIHDYLAIYELPPC